METLLNQIQTWLKLPQVWRFVGFASAIIGLLCFALSSSFNSLFGEWNFLKSFLYTMFSFIICVAVFFSKTWQHSSNLQLKAHMAFLVLTITSLYSSFFDKHVNRKPDAYSLVSCTAFAVMSLGLSRQTHFGFEVDLLYFFLGSLIVQLTKIEWLLGIVGAGFGYSLIILRSCLDAQQEVNGYGGVQHQPQVDIQVGSLQLLASIDALKKMNTNFLRQISSYKNHNYRAKSIQPDQNLFIDSFPQEIINNLNEAMKVAVEAGFEEECCHLYTCCRKEFLRECFSALHMQDFFNCEYDYVGTTTERIQGWNRASDVAVKIVFPNERRLCDRVFLGLSSVGDLAFMKICMEPTISLLRFPKAFKVNITHISMPVIRRELAKVVWTLPNIIPELESLFPGQDVVSLSNEAITTRNRLNEAIKNFFRETCNLISSDTRIAYLPGGIYPIISDIMDYLRAVIDFKPVIERAWKAYPVSSDGGGTPPSFHVEIAWIIGQLESHLESMSENYTEPALCYVSIMNNLMYIKQEIISWQIEDLGKSFQFQPSFFNNKIQKFTSKVQQNLEDYHRVEWTEMLGLLKLDNEEESVALGVIAESMTEKIQLFNIQFEHICSIQSKWFAIDDIRKEIIEGLENMLLPAYGNFIGRFQDALGKHASMYIRFGMFDIKAQLNDMFLEKKREQ